jgi:CheY-like chemotaxis protein/PAS domain-containing protein
MTSGAASGAIRVLLVGDDPGFAALVVAQLDDAGVHADLEVAGSLAAGIAALQARPRECVLLDLGLQDADQEDNIRRIAAAAGPTPVIALSGEPDTELPNRARRAGALDFVDKAALDGPCLSRLLAQVATGSRSRPLPVETFPPSRAVVLAPAVAAAFAGAVGVVAVIGWITGSRAVLSWGALPTIKLNGALALIAAATAVALLRDPSAARRRVALVACAGVGGWAVLTLLEWILGRSLGIDQLLVRDPATSGVPGRSSPHTAAALALLAGALMTLDAKAPRARLVHFLLGAAFQAAVVLAALGWLFGSSLLTGHSHITGMSPPTLAGLFALLAGSFFLRPTAAPFALLRGGTPAASLMRRLIPAALVVPPLLGGVRLLGELADLYDDRFGLALFATSMMVTFVALTVATARAVDRGDYERRVTERTLSDSESRVRTLARLAPVGILESDISGACTNVNPAWCEQTGLAMGSRMDRSRTPGGSRPCRRAAGQRAGGARGHRPRVPHPARRRKRTPRPGASRPAARPRRCGHRTALHDDRRDRATARGAAGEDRARTASVDPRPSPGGDLSARTRRPLPGRQRPLRSRVRPTGGRDHRQDGTRPASRSARRLGGGARAPDPRAR